MPGVFVILFPYSLRLQKFFEISKFQSVFEIVNFSFFIYVSIYVFVFLFVYVSVCLTLCLPTCLSVIQSMCVPICLYMCLSMCLSVSLSIRILPSSPFHYFILSLTIFVCLSI
jgi:hypothetical protein